MDFIKLYIFCPESNKKARSFRFVNSELKALKKSRESKGRMMMDFVGVKRRGCPKSPKGDFNNTT